MFRAAEVLEECRREGLRITAPRRAIFEALDGDASHPSAWEVLARVRRRHPRVSFTTVYTTLEMLARRGAIAKLAIDPERARFDANPVPHDHAVCERCGRIEDLPPRGGRPRGPRGFRVSRVHVEFHGLCRGCRG
jgi:Fur family peroxide stress response transcriptional regulator